MYMYITLVIGDRVILIVLLFSRQSTGVSINWEEMHSTYYSWLLFCLKLISITVVLLILYILVNE